MIREPITGPVSPVDVGERVEILQHSTDRQRNM